MPNYKIGIDIDSNTGNSAKEIGGVAGALDGLDGALAGGAGNVDLFGSAMGALTSPIGLVTTGVGALAGALIATGAHAMNLATEVENSTALMTTQLGLTDEKAQGFEETMRSIYTNNYGESFEDIAASMVAVEQQFGRIGGTENQQQLQQVTELALGFADAFDKDVSESTGAAVTLMENFGLSATQAFDFLVAGQQRGLDSSGDFLDSIGEYSPQFGQMEASAAQFFSVLESGNAGGVLGTDKVADAFKEFNIRIVDDSKTTKDALASIGISYDTLTAGFADGSISITDAAQMVIDKITEIEDPIERNKAGVALFGTQWEDMTETMLLEVDLQKTALEDLEGAAASLGDQYDTTANKGQTAMREWNNALVDVGDAFNDMKDVILPALTTALEIFVIPKIKELTGWLQQAVDLLEGAGDFFQWLMGGGTVPTAGAQASALSVQSSGAAIPVSLGGNGAGGAVTAAGSQVTQHFYIERGDAATVQEAAQIGVGRAQLAMGF